MTRTKRYYILKRMDLTSGFKKIDLKDLNKYTSNSSKRCVLEVDLEYPIVMRTTQSLFFSSR